MPNIECRTFKWRNNQESSNDTAQVKMPNHTYIHELTMKLSTRHNFFCFILFLLQINGINSSIPTQIISLVLPVVKAKASDKPDMHIYQTD